MDEEKTNIESPQAGEVIIAPEKKPFNIKLWGIVALAAIIVIAGGYFAYANYGEQLGLKKAKEEAKTTNTTTTTTTETPTTTTPTTTDETADWKTLPLGLIGGSIKYPLDMTLTESESSEYETQIQSHKINYRKETRKDVNGKDYTSEDMDGFVYQYNILEWLKGAVEGEGYVLNKEKRAGLLAVMKELYKERELSSAIKNKLNSYNLEFMTYSSSDRVYVGYLESKDGKARGLSMINTHGQDTGLATSYSAVLYNQEKNAVVSVFLYTLSGSEIDKIKAQYGDYQSVNIDQIDKQVHEDFAKLIADTPRANLSFGSKMTQFDNIVKSWAY